MTKKLKQNLTWKKEVEQGLNKERERERDKRLIERCKIRINEKRKGKGT